MKSAAAAFSGSPAPSFAFGRYRLDPGEGILRRSGKPVDLFPKAVELLAVLVAARGSVVRKETLLKTVWASTFVEENTLARYVSILRKALGSERYIETVSRRGYRFTAPVKELAEAAPAREATVSSVAFMPLKSPDPELDYLCEGLTERLIAGLSRVPGLKVMGSTTVFRYRKRDFDPRQIARELAVESVFCGRLIHRAGGLELAGELCDARGARIWGDQIDVTSSPAPAWETELVRTIALALKRSWSPGETGLSTPGDAATRAYHLYLKGLYNFNKCTPAAISKSADYFRRALDVDSRLALAHVGLGFAYSVLSWVWVGTMSPAEVRPIMESAASRALELDPTVPEAHVLHGDLLVWHHWKWREAERAYRRALELNSQCIHARRALGFFLGLLGRLDEAESLLTGALELDPLSSVVGMHLAWLSYLRGRYSDAIRRCEETLELEPGFGPIHIVLGLCYERKKLLEQAVAELDRGQSHLGKNTMVASIRVHLLGRMGRGEEAAAALDELLRLSKSRYVSAVDLAIGYASVGEREKVFELLKTAYRERSFGLVLLNSLPFLDSVRSSPRFTELLRRVGLAR